MWWKLGQERGFCGSNDKKATVLDKKNLAFIVHVEQCAVNNNLFFIREVDSDYQIQKRKRKGKEDKKEVGVDGQGQGF